MVIPERWPTTGRDDELDTIGELLDPQRPCSVVISGPPGVGRTRLAREALATATRAGLPVHWAAGAAAAASVPLGAMAHLVPAGTATDATDSFGLLRRAMDALTRDDLPSVLGVDDAHLLDELSLTLLHQLATSGRVALVATARTGGPAPDRLAPLWKDGAAVLLELAPLARPDADRLLAAAVGGDVDTRTAERLWRLCRGHPLYLRELVHAGLRSGQLQDGTGLWRWDGTIVAPPRLVEIVMAEHDGLDEEQEAALDVLAIGGPLDLERLVALSGRDAVAGLERRGLLSVDARGRACTVHPLHAEVVRDRMPGATASRLRAALADGADNRLAHTELLVSGTLPLDTDGREADADRLTEAARRANAAFDHAGAERLARAAVERGGSAQACLALLDALRWRGRAGEVEELAREVAPRMSGDRDRVRLAVLRAVNLHRALRRPDEAVALLEETAAAVPEGPARDVPAAMLGVLAFLEGEPRRVPVPGAPEAAAAAAAAAAGGLAMTGAVRDALREVARGRDALARLPDGDEVVFVGLVLAHAELMALRIAGRVRDLERRAVELHEQSMAASDWAGDAVAALHLGCAALAAGRLPRAARWLTEALAGLRRRDPVGLLGVCHAELARVRALLGDRDGAGELLDAGPGTVGALSEQARAWVVIGSGAVSEAVEVVLAAADDAAGRGTWGVEAELRHVAVQFGRPDAVARRLRELVRHTDSALVELFAEHAEAAAADAGGELDRVAAAFEERGSLLAAADAGAAAGAAHHRSGDRRRASMSGSKAAVFAAECGGPRTPALQRSAPPRLTVREREVADLVAAGLSNADIARRLVLSVRTVETHLAHVYAKLRVNDRTALGEVTRERTVS